MADWRQIQARIRKAKTGSNAAEQLAELYERTRDAMVAFELANWYEKAGEMADAVKWFTTAAERFRRAQWRVKAEEALTRLGAPIPPKVSESAASADSASATSETAAEPGEDQPREPAAENTAQERFPYAVRTQDNSEAKLSAAPSGEAGATENLTEPGNEHATEGEPETAAAAAATPEGVRKRRRRGRRGGRNRRREGVPGDDAHAPSAPPGRVPARPVEFSTPSSPSPVREIFQPAPRTVELQPVQERERSYEPAAASAPSGPWQGRMRAGEPALASRMAQLESQLRRMLACQPASLDEADQAPAGPGVLVLSDSDQVTHYYIEACRTLRIGIDNLLRGARGSKGGGQLKELMAENLGIPESRVSKYLKDHCAVRWLQLDEGAPELAHFAIAVLRPVVNE